MVSTSVKSLPNIEYFQIDFTKKDLLPLIKEVKQVKKNPKKFLHANSLLAGKIKNEFFLKTSNQFLNNLLLPYVNDYAIGQKLFETFSVNDNDNQLKLNETWVNFQKKGEHNPIHIHSGVVSFVIWLKIPYNIAKEIEIQERMYKKYSLGGEFYFHYIDVIGTLQTFPIIVDKNSLYKCILFPSRLAHSVNSFYSSKGTRISVSGNFVYDA